MEPVLSGEEWIRALNGVLVPRSHDDVSITVTGRRLDSRTAVMAFCAEMEAEFGVRADATQA